MFDTPKSSSRASILENIEENEITNDIAVNVDKVKLSYGKFSSSQASVLNDLSMEVPRGSIYGLLGPSGCGKTSLIRCILGTLHVNSGRIKVFGVKPAGSNSKVPGPGVGYMPQEISLYSDLTIGETLHYFASLYGLTNEQIAERSNFLISFLNLPDQNRFVGKLSSGQKRRVSLATALIHKSPLLILDEPTVGVDPLLRKSIWAHLTELSQSDKLTVLVTTHYIEEARDANLVGLMRDGRILEQDSPEMLLRRYQLNTLEQVFLHLCTSEGHNKQHQKILADVICEQSRVISSASSSITTDSDRFANDLKNEPQLASIKDSNSFSQIGTMIRKNLKSLLRSPGYLLFQFLLPMIEAMLFCLCLGLDLHSIPVAIYDGDHSELSRSILHEVNQRTIAQKYFLTHQAALTAVQQGSVSTALFIYPNFTNCLVERLTKPQDVSPETLYNSTVHLAPDMSNQLMVNFVQKEVVRAFSEVARKYLKIIGKSANMLEPPVQLDPPVYGAADPPFTNFILPGAILGIAFFAALSLTTMNLVVERKRGLIERTIVVGVSHFRILFAHLLTHSFVLLVQVGLLLVMIFSVFKIPYHGSLFCIAALTAAQSFCGMCFGLLVSSVADSENTATMLSLGAFYPTLLLSGSIWPVEAMNDFLRYISLTLPETIPIQSMRYMIIRGWGIDHWEVASGFMVTLGWSALFLLLSTIVARFKI